MLEDLHYYSMDRDDDDNDLIGTASDEKPFFPPTIAWMLQWITTKGPGQQKQHS
jgi:hypothetical protein